VSAALLALSSAPSPDEAERLGRLLVERGLAACVNLLPGVRSIYRWKGQLNVDSECLLLIKTSRERFEELRQALVAAHPYELPELIAVEIGAGHAPYLEWLAESSRGGSA
jgi:periplasmic divalent cation tolerance protein